MKIQQKRERRPPGGFILLDAVRFHTYCSFLHANRNSRSTPKQTHLDVPMCVLVWFSSTNYNSLTEIWLFLVWEILLKVMANHCLKKCTNPWILFTSKILFKDYKDEKVKNYPIRHRVILKWICLNLDLFHKRVKVKLHLRKQ